VVNFQNKAEALLFSYNFSNRQQSSELWYDDCLEDMMKDSQYVSWPNKLFRVVVCINVHSDKRIHLTNTYK